MVASARGNYKAPSARLVVRPLRTVSYTVLPPLRKKIRKKGDGKSTFQFLPPSQVDEESSTASYPTSSSSVLESDGSLSLLDDLELPSFFEQTSLDLDLLCKTVESSEDGSDQDVCAPTDEGDLAFGHFIQHIAHSDYHDIFTLPTIPKKRTPLLESFDLAGIAKYIKQRPGCRTLVLTGAGVSVAAGIPDFRTPGTGLYSRLERYQLPTPTAIFDLDYFPDRPEPFYTLAKELWPGNYAPTLVHTFVTLMHEKNLLLRSYTQNIDGLDLVAGLPPDALVEVHGTFATARCLKCRRAHSSAVVREAVFGDQIPRCHCGGLIKPDIVFFGEQLPDRFFDLVQEDFEDVELVIVIGTSLQVAPFSDLPERCDDDIPRLLINNEVVGEASAFHPQGFDFSDRNYRDAKMIGDCQQGVLELADLLGWKQELLDRYGLQQRTLRGFPEPAELPKPAWLLQQPAVQCH